MLLYMRGWGGGGGGGGGGKNKCCKAGKCERCAAQQHKHAREDWACLLKIILKSPAILEH